MTYKKYTDPRARATRDKIVNAYAELLSEKDREYISINDICSKSHINRSTFYRHYLNLSDIEEDIEKTVLNKFMQLLDNIDLDDFLHGRKEFLNTVNETIVSEIGFYSKILLVNQNVSFLEKINSSIRDRLRTTLIAKTSIPPAQIDLILTFAVAGRTAVYRRWIINGFKPSAEVVSESNRLPKLYQKCWKRYLLPGLIIF